MADDTTLQFQSILQRMKKGDVTARRALLDAACNRLSRLAAHIFTGSFPTLANRHEVDSIVHETWLRLAQAMESVEPESLEHFFRLAAQKVRQVLLDMIERGRRGRNMELLGSSDGSSQMLTNGGLTYDPSRLAVWTEFHQKVSALPEDEKAVFEMHYYLDLPQAEIATILDVHPRKVSRLWVCATDKLANNAVGSEC